MATNGTVDEVDNGNRSFYKLSASARAIMPNKQRKPRSFGADDILACLNCSQPVSLTKRPDADYNLRYERQIFACRACGHRNERIVDAEGNPPE